MWKDAKETLEFIQSKIESYGRAAAFNAGGHQASTEIGEFVAGKVAGGQASNSEAAGATRPAITDDTERATTTKEVLDLLRRRYPTWMTPREVVAALHEEGLIVRVETVGALLSKLADTRDVVEQEIRRQKAYYRVRP